MSGAWVANIYETGHAHKVASFSDDLTQAITFTDPKNTTFAGKFQFTMPAPTTSGEFTVSLMATDQAKALYFCLQIHYAISTAADTGADEARHHIPGSYWCAPHRAFFRRRGAHPQAPPRSMHDPTKQPPYYCHIPGPITCDSDSQCAKYYGAGTDTYCMNGPSKSAPYYCHAPAPRQCKSDTDC